MLRRTQLPAPSLQCPADPPEAFSHPQLQGAQSGVPSPRVEEISPCVWKDLSPHVCLSLPGRCSECGHNPSFSSAGSLFRSDVFSGTTQTTSSISATYCLSVQLQTEFDRGKVLLAAGIALCTSRDWMPNAQKATLQGLA